VEQYEKPERAAERECLEETGIPARAISEISRQHNWDTKGRPIKFTTITFLLETQGPLEVILSKEHEAYRWVDFKEASNLSVVWHLPLTLERYFASNRD
jgi:8-oxo-dGTP pyrophosphatase MutT (NUDIX family)